MPYNPNAIWGSKQPNPPPAETVKPTAKEPAITVGKEPNVPGSKRHTGLWLVGIAILGFGIAGFFLYRFFMPQALPAAAVRITAPEKVSIGDPFAVAIAVQNTSAVVLKNVKLNLGLPDGVSAVGIAQGQTPVSFLIGDIATGTTITETSTLIATSGSGSAASLAAEAAYEGNPGSQVRFQASGSASVALGDPAIALSVAVPASAVVGSQMVVALTYANNTPDTIGDVRVALAAPPAFSFSTSSIARVSASGTVWDVGTLAPHSTGTIAAYGSLASTADAVFGFTGSIIISTSSESYTIAGPTANIALHQAPLSLAISVNGSSSYVAALNDFLAYTIHYANHASVALQGVAVRAKLTGSMFDLSSAQSNGSFDSLTNTVMWSPSTVPVFASLAPGASGDLTLRVRVHRDFPIRSAADRNFSLRVDGAIVSPTVLPGVVATSTAGTAILTTKIAGTVAVASRGYRYDDASGIMNAGPYPPVVNHETQYTIHWTVTDSADDLQNVVLSATLPTGIIFTAKATSNVSTTPQYNPTTGMVTWTIRAVPATAGVAALAPQAVFQVAATPAVNQIGQSISLLGKTSAQAIDAFTGQTLTATADAVTTDLPDDQVAKQIRNNAVQGN
jgi:Domain of unknown function DUF11